MAIASLPSKGRQTTSIIAVLLNSQTLGFWLCQGLGWLAYALIVYFSVVEPNLSTTGVTEALLHLATETFTGLLLTTTLRYLIHALKDTDHGFWWVVGGATILLSALWNAFKLIAHHSANEYPLLGWSVDTFTAWYMFSLMTFVAWVAIYFTFVFSRQFHEAETKALLAEAAAKESQLQMLRYQLNPHFLFNSMNALSTLILKKDNHSAIAMLDALCSFLRTSLNLNPDSKITLESELESLKLYLEIEKLRFGDRLNVDYEIAKTSMDCLVPNFILQPIVENAIKYAISTRKEGGRIWVKAQGCAAGLIIEIADNGLNITRPEEGQKGLGIGLKNTADRLDALYGASGSVELKPSDPLGTLVVLKMPCEKKGSK